MEYGYLLLVYSGGELVDLLPAGDSRSRVFNLGFVRDVPESSFHRRRVGRPMWVGLSVTRIRKIKMTLRPVIFNLCSSGVFRPFHKGREGWAGPQVLGEKKHMWVTMKIHQWLNLFFSHARFFAREKTDQPNQPDQPPNGLQRGWFCSMLDFLAVRHPLVVRLTQPAERKNSVESALIVNLCRTDYVYS